jgi:serine/threonine protein kinase
MFPQIFGKYVLEREIAAGGMARVYLATLRGAVGFEKRLVVKQIRPELACDEAFVRRFVEEAKTAVELNHPNIVPVFELGVEAGVYYLAMEFCPGLTLADVLAETGPLDAAEGAYVGADVCRALDYAHRRAGIVHRDVTPRNVLIDDEGAVRLIDFGIAAPVERSGKRAREIFGSPGHMPPEQLRGDALTPATDVFAVGALLIEAWTGKPPFRRATPRESAKAIETPPTPIDVAQRELAPLTELLLMAVSPNPASRPADAEQLARPLRDFLRTTDSGDLARRLGDRVRRARLRLGEARPSRPPPARDSVGPAQATPTAAIGSRTFAARDELAVWTRRLGSTAPPPPNEPQTDFSTRRLSDRPVSGSPSSAPAERSRPVEPRGSAPGSVPPVRRSSIATRPSARPTRFGLGLVPRGILAVVFTLAGALFAFGLTRLFGGPAPASSASEPPGGPAAAPPAPASTPQAMAVGISQRPAVRAPPEPGARRAEPVGSAARAPLASSERSSRALAASERAGTAVAASATATSDPAAAPATLRLTADPPAMVTVEGEGVSRTTPTPVAALALSPGSYRVIFRNETYGPPVATRVQLRAGALLRVHADFREAEPRVTVR